MSVYYTYMQQITRRKSARQIKAEYKKNKIEQAKLAKQLQQFSKDDYDTLNWALFYTMTEVEKKRGFKEGEKEHLLRLLYQTDQNATNPTKSLALNDLRACRNNFNLTGQEIVKEVEEAIKLEKELIKEEE